MATRRWTEQEEEKMMDLIYDLKEPSTTWESVFEAVAEEMDGRTVNAVRDRFYYLTREQEETEEEIRLDKALQEVRQNLQTAMNQLDKVESEIEFLMNWIEETLMLKEKLLITTDKDYRVTKIKKERRK